MLRIAFNPYLHDYARASQSQVVVYEPRLEAASRWPYGAARGNRNTQPKIYG